MYESIKTHYRETIVTSASEHTHQNIQSSVYITNQPPDGCIMRKISGSNKDVIITDITINQYIWAGFMVALVQASGSQSVC